VTNIKLYSLPLKIQFYTSYPKDPTVSHRQNLQIPHRIIEWFGLEGTVYNISSDLEIWTSIWTSR